MYTNKLHQELFQPLIKKTWKKSKNGGEEKDCSQHFVFRPATEETEDSAGDIL